MALTIALCVGSFVVIYAKVDPLTRDFIAAPATATPTEAPKSTKAASAASSTDSPSNNQTAQQDETPEPTPTERPPEQAAAPTATPSDFIPTHLSNTETAVNFREGPGTDSGVVQLLDAGTPLKATGQEETDSDGLVWLEFETEDGTVGWIREIDSVPQS